MITTFQLTIGGTGCEITGPSEWCTPLSRAWSEFSGQLDSNMRVDIMIDDTLAKPGAPLFETLPKCLNGTCKITTFGFSGSVDPVISRSQLRVHSSASLADIVYFIRIAYAVQAFACGAALFHTAAVVHDNWAYAFFGLSGSGKTTVATLSSPDPVLNDDLVVLTQTCGEYAVHSTPFSKRRGNVLSAPLRAMLRLVKSSDIGLGPISRSQAIAELTANTPVISGDAGWLPQAMKMWTRVVEDIPVYALEFRRDATFWEVIDDKFRSNPNAES